MFHAGTGVEGPEEAKNAAQLPLNTANSVASNVRNPLVNIVEVPIPHAFYYDLTHCSVPKACARYCELLKIEIMCQTIHVHRQPACA
jgi:hypothetical protein